jgi:hypothetical protein
MRKINQGWRDRTEDGEVREVMGVRDRAGWTIKSRLKGEEEWTQHPKPDRRDVEELIAILTLKYQRSKGTLREVEVAKKLLLKCR